MNLNNRYLSDEELNALISEIEQDDLIMAPPDLKAEVLRRMVDTKRTFIMYCFRVITSVAAAIVLILLLPGTINGKQSDREIPSREEVLKKQEYVSREEALDDTGFIQKLFNQFAVLEGNIASAIMMNENGGE